jgi:hypothetical protein
LQVARNWPIVAANVPRPIASEVAKGGLDVLAPKTGDDRRLFARDLACPASDPYFARFVDAMGGHPAGGSGADEAARTNQRYFQAQCLKDETMAESIAQALTAAAGTNKAMVVHYNGAFHTDYGQGTAERVRRRLPGKARRRALDSAGGQFGSAVTRRRREKVGGVRGVHHRAIDRPAARESPRDPLESVRL